MILAADGPLKGRLEASGVTVEVLALDEEARSTTRLDVDPGAHTAVMGFRVLRYSWRLSRRIRQIRPDLVHTNSLKSAVYGSLAARLAGVPVICHLRDRLATDYMSAWGRRMMRVVLRVLPQAVIANSRATMATLAPSTSAVRIFGAVAYDPIPAHTRRGTEADEGPVVIGMVGRLSEWKGQHVFIEAFARAFPRSGATALIVGSAMFEDAAYEERIRRQVSDLGLDARVELTGFAEDVNAYLSRMDILVHASVIPEPFGQVVVEGMAAALPVIAADAGGPGETIIDGVDGLLYPPGDVEALAAAMTRLARSPERREAMGIAARRKAAEFRPGRIADQVMAVYRTLVPTAGG